MTTTAIIDRKEGYTQVCVWPGVTMGQSSPSDFEQFIAEEFGTRVQFLECVTTKPDIGDNGQPVNETGGRSDLLFAVHIDDVSKFAVPRLKAGIRWIEDVLDEHNHSRHMYDCERLDQYKTW